MGDGQEQDHYVEQLREVFNSFDSSGSGSLSQDELSDLCLSLHLEEATPTLIQALLHDQDQLHVRINFEQFKNALILVLSSTIEQHDVEQEPPPKPASPEIQPKFVKGSKRYGRRSTPEFIEPVSDLHESCPNHDQYLEENYDTAVPCKRERWNAHETSTGEEYEAEGQLHLWNPDEPSTPRGSTFPLSGRLEERIHEACEDMALSWDGFASCSELLALCDQLGIEVTGEVLQTLNTDEVMNVQEFVSRALNHNKPSTPSASTPYRQFKRMHSIQPFDEGGRRIATPSALTSTIGLRLFSSLDDGTGYTLVEHILDTWMEEGIENSAEILQALNFSLDGKLSLGDLTMALENELLVTKNGIHQAALASFKAEIRHLLACVDRELREKEKIQSDLEKAERLKSQLATEVDEHHSAIEQMNKVNLRKLEQDHKDKLSSMRSELMKEMDQMQQQAGLQREELEAEIEKIREDESFLRDHLSISVKENRRLEVELLDNAEKLVEAQNQISKLQANLDNIMKEKFGDLDPGSAEFFLQEERIKQLHISYEAQCRELQDRIDELQSELREFHSIGRVHQSCSKPLSEELESKSPGMESDPGIGSEEVQPFSMSLEAEMMLERLKDRHLQEMDELRNQLEAKICDFEKIVEKQRTSHTEQKAAMAQQHQHELQALKEHMSSIQNHAEELQRRLEEVKLNQSKLEEAEETAQEEEAQKLRQQLLEAHIKNADLEEQLGSLEEQQTEMNDSFNREIEELKRKHAEEISQQEQTQAEELQEEKLRLLSEFEKENNVLKQNYENELRAKLEEMQLKFEKERDEIVQRLTEQWQKERVQLDERNTEALQVLLEEEMLKLVKEHEEKENRLREQLETEKSQIEQQHEDAMLQRLHQQTVEFELREKRLKEEWETEKLQLEEDYESMVQERVGEEKVKMEAEREEAEKKFERLMGEEKERIQEKHQELVKELTDRHREEREELSSTLDKLRGDIALERSLIEKSFSQRLREVEERFTVDQEAVAEKFQADVLRLEQHYQTELKAVCENHKKEKCVWEEQIKHALENTEEQRRTLEAILEKERDRITEQWTSEIQEIENVHKEEMEALDVKNKQLQSELDELISQTQLREIDLSKQLNELHSRLQENLDAKEELVFQAQKQAAETEQMLKEMVQNLEQERAELEAKYKEIVSISEKQIMERIELLTERDDLKLKIEGLEMLVRKMKADFDEDRLKMQQTLCALEKKLKSGLQEGNGEELLVERDLLRSKIKKLEMEACQVLTFVEKVDASGIEEDRSQTEVGQFSACEDTASDAAVSDSSQSSSSLDEDGTDGLETPVEDNTIDTNSENGCYVSRPESCEVIVDEDNMASSHESQQNKPVQGKMIQEQCHYFNCEDDKDPILTLCPDLKPHSGASTLENKPEEVCLHETCEKGEDFKSTNVAKDENRCENKPQDILELEFGSISREGFCSHATAVELLELEDADELGQWLEEEASCPKVSHKHNDITEFVLPEITLENSEDQDVIKLTALYSTASEENILLHEKISLLQQKIEILETLLAHNNDKLKTGHQVLEENYSLKVKLLLFMEHIKELERKAVKMADLQIRYEDCMCENDKLKEQNAELEKKVWSHESRVNVYDRLQDNQVTLQDEISQMREENGKLSELLGELEGPTTRFFTDLPESRSSVSPLQDDTQDLNSPLKVHAVNDLEDCCIEFEKQNSKLRRAITELQDQSQTMTVTTHAHRSEACRLSEENLLLKKKIDALKEEDLKELMLTMENLKKEKFASERAADDFKKQISELQSQSHFLEDKNGMLSVKNSQHLSDMEALRQQVAALVENERKEKIPSEDKSQLAACVSALEAELTKALDDTEQLKHRNSMLSLEVCALREKVETMDSLKLDLSSLAEEKKTLVKETQILCNQLAKAQEKVKVSDENLQAATLQSSRLKADVRVLQQQKDSLHHEVALLHKKLQNANDKNHVLERAMHSTGLQSHSKKLLREELARLMEQDQKLLKQENEKLQAEVLTVKGDLRQAREKVHQLDGTIVSLKQQKQSHSSLLLNLEQENLSLKQQLETQKEKNKGREAGGGLPDMDSILQENEALKAQMARLSTQLIETFQVQLVGLLPPSPHRTPRGQQRGEEAENLQDERERKMKIMEERMKEIELSLHNVKLLLKEKVAQLKQQLQKNGKADVLIKDLYVENDQLLKALELTEQRNTIAEKKNFLLEAKISSLTKILRDLSPSTLPTLQYHFTCS